MVELRVQGMRVVPPVLQSYPADACPECRVHGASPRPHAHRGLTRATGHVGLGSGFNESRAWEKHMERILAERRRRLLEVAAFVRGSRGAVTGEVIMFLRSRFGLGVTAAWHVLNAAKEEGYVAVAAAVENVGKVGRGSGLRWTLGCARRVEGTFDGLDSKHRIRGVGGVGRGGWVVGRVRRAAVVAAAVGS